MKVASVKLDEKERIPHIEFTAMLREREINLLIRAMSRVEKDEPIAHIRAVAEDFRTQLVAMRSIIETRGL